MALGQRVHIVGVSIFIPLFGVPVSPINQSDGVKFPAECVYHVALH